MSGNVSKGLQGGFYINDLYLRLVLQTDMPVVDDTDSSRAFSQERMSKLKAEATLMHRIVVL